MDPCVIEALTIFPRMPFQLHNGLKGVRTRKGNPRKKDSAQVTGVAPLIHPILCLDQFRAFSPVASINLPHSRAARRSSRCFPESLTRFPRFVSFARQIFACHASCVQTDTRSTDSDFSTIVVLACRLGRTKPQ